MPSGSTPSGGSTLLIGASESDLERERLMIRVRELVTALDARLPRLDERAERRIAREAATLRSEAVARIDTLADHE